MFSRAPDFVTDSYLAFVEITKSFFKNLCPYQENQILSDPFIINICIFCCFCFIVRCETYILQPHSHTILYYTIKAPDRDFFWTNSLADPKKKQVKMKGL